MVIAQEVRFKPFEKEYHVLPFGKGGYGKSYRLQLSPNLRKKHVKKGRKVIQTLKRFTFYEFFNFSLDNLPLMRNACILYIYLNQPKIYLVNENRDADFTKMELSENFYGQWTVGEPLNIMT